MRRPRPHKMPPEPLEEGRRVGRFVVLRDVDGQMHAVSAGAVCAISSTDDGALVMLSGARTLHVGASMETLLGWLDGRP